ncbi:MAG: hypothetical protein QHI38_06650 [Armatimonadota bacterium]|nr:hypothetical protein [Armatimonadota bacterium]
MARASTTQLDQDTIRQAAKRYLADRAYLHLLGIDQPAKLRQILKGVGVEKATPRLLKHVMSESDRFATVDRRWAPAVRYGDTRRPFERILDEIMSAAGIPLSIDPIARELGQTFGRPADAYFQTLPRVLANREKYFRTPSDRYGLARWVVIPTSEDEADVIFDNFLSEEQVAHYVELCEGIAWSSESISDSAAQAVEAGGGSAPVKILSFLAWRALGEDYDPGLFYEALLNNSKVVVLSDQTVYPHSAVKAFTSFLGQLAEELAALPIEPEEEEAEGPVEITDTDKEEIIALILDRGTASAEELLESVLEVSPDEPAFAGTLQNLFEALKDDSRVMYLGDNRWSKVITFPEEVKVIPESLIVRPIEPFETPEGDVYDLMLDEEGFEGDLKVAIYDPLAQDVTDEDPARTDYQPNGDSQRCVLKYHHKVEGTFPLCQINPEFFGVEPEIIPITLIRDGMRKQVFVNNSTRLIYGLKEFYKDITDVSGAVFYIERTPKPGEFRFRYEGEVDSQLGIDTDRSLELLDIKARCETQEMPVHDIVVEILERRPGGMTFPQLVNEVNIVRRCSRLLIASILSSYHYFTMRGKTGRWQYDEKKRSQGFNKSKRKYIKK